MVTKIQKWGNSQGVRFPKAVLEQMHMQVGDEVEISVHDGQIVINPVHQTRQKYLLADLLADMPDIARSEEVDWGAPEGNEEW